MIGSDITNEQLLLGSIYVQALKAVGYKMETDFALVGPEFRREVLARDQIAGYPEHTNAALETLFGVKPEDIPSDPKEAYEMVKAEFEKEGLTVFSPAPFSYANAVGVLKRTAEERGLKTVSDLDGQAEKMTLKGPEGCDKRADCLAGLETHYGIEFKSFSSFSEVESDADYEALESGEDDASILTTTDGELGAKNSKFVILEEDKHALPAGNVVFVTSPGFIEEAGSDFEAAIVDAQEGLTLPVMQKLGAQMQEGMEVEKVAAGYLRSIDLSD